MDYTDTNQDLFSLHLRNPMFPFKIYSIILKYLSNSYNIFLFEVYKVERFPEVNQNVGLKLWIPFNSGHLALNSLNNMFSQPNEISVVLFVVFNNWFSFEPNYKK